MEKKKGLGGFDKVLIGCGIGCGALIMLVLVGGAVGTAWLFSSGDQISTGAIVGEGSLGVIRLHELADDPGTQALLTRVLVRLAEINREQQREDLPPSLRWLPDLQGSQTNAQSLNMWIPREMTISYEAAADGDGVDYVVAVNPRIMVRFIRTMFSLFDQEGREEEYRGHPFYQIDEESEARLAFLGSTVLYASSRDALLRAIDRVEDGDTEHREPAGSGAIPDGDWDLEGVFGDEEGIIEALLVVEEPGDEPLDTADLHLGFGLDVVSGDEIAGQMIVECGDPDTARRWLATLEQRYQRMTREAAENGLELEIEARAEGDRVVTELRLSGLEAAIDEALSSAEAGKEEAGEEEAGEEEARGEGVTREGSP